jgi:hypothetical protein
MHTKKGVTCFCRDKFVPKIDINGIGSPKSPKILSPGCSKQFHSKQNIGLGCEIYHNKGKNNLGSCSPASSSNNSDDLNFMQELVPPQNRIHSSLSRHLKSQKYYTNKLLSKMTQEDAEKADFVKKLIK